MSPEGSVSRWLEQLKAGDREAVQCLWECYWQRLVALARQRLRDAPRGAADEEDVALSAFESFCRGAEQGRFPRLDDRGNLWALLMRITNRKAFNQKKHDLAARRGAGKVQQASALPAEESEAGVLDHLISREPDPLFAAEMAEECRRLLDLLGEADHLREVALWKLEGFTNEEVAGKLGRTVATVERKLSRIRGLWERDRQER
jgi:DNA-directed RNA polymerase specialized sigma24 family protein